MKSMWDNLYKKGDKPEILKLFEEKAKPEPRPARVAKDWRPLVGWLAGGYLGEEMDDHTRDLVGKVLRDDARRQGLG